MLDTKDKDLADEQHQDDELQPIIFYLEENKLPEDHKSAQKIISEATLYAMSDVGKKQIEMPREDVPRKLRLQIL